ncbi:MAG: mevalonate kinase [Anaerolineae bacterium]|jgi:mevalonate kinase|nr:mevalonate kinase [Anaerolineae bacterium]MDH7472758.1 mevalonate kinase [Anaerolineae bacterium]
MTLAYASGKAILFGEHAVVYGRPAIAVPITEVQAQAIVEDAPSGQGIRIIAQDLHRDYLLRDAPPDDPLRVTVTNTLQHLHRALEQDITLTISSTIPVACGLGSGAAVATAVVRALARHFGHPLEADEVSDIVFETEKLHHGTPSGIDNTVIAFEKPVYFVRDQTLEVFKVSYPFLLAIADTGIASPTKIAVGDVRRAWQADPVKYEEIFDEIGTLTTMARQAIESGATEALGQLMDANQRLLRLLKVSSPELESLIAAAKQGGALGAKLSGGGRGGNMIALVTPQTKDRVSMMLRLAGAKSVITTEVH